MIVITGAYGFIGSNLVAELESQSNEELVLVDEFGVGDKWKNMLGRRLHTMIRPHEIFEYIENNRNKISCVIHMGAISSTIAEDVDGLIDNNYRFSIHLVELCSAYEIRIIYASSASVYGNGEMGFIDTDDVASISQLRPLNAYGWSKKLIDEECAKRQFKNIVALRFFNVYGPNEYHKGEQASVIYKWYTLLKSDQPISLFRSYLPECKDGYQKRDFVYVQDCIDVVLWFMRNKEKEGVFNVGTGIARTFVDIIEHHEYILQKKAQCVYVDMPEQIRKHYQYYTRAELSKLRQAGYVKNMMSLEDGISAYITSYLNNKYYR